MAQKSFSIDGVGQVTIYKRRGAKNIRLSLTPSGKVRISQPFYTPYQAGITFVKVNRRWLARRAVQEAPPALIHGQRIGKNYRLVLKPASSKIITTLVKNHEICIRFPAGTRQEAIQETALSACERALRKEAKELLPPRLERLASENGFSYKSVRIKKFTARWGSCSSDKNITLSYYLVQLPWELIDYVLLHELTHTRQMNHGPAFWRELTAIVPTAKDRQKWIRQHKPRLSP